MATTHDHIKGPEGGLGATDVLLSTATRLAGIGTFRWDLTADKLCCSERTAQLLGLAPDDRTPTTRRVIETAVHPTDRDRAFELRDRSLTQAAPVPASEWLLVDPSDHTRWICMNMEPARFEGSRVVEMAGSMLDVTAHHEWERERDLLLAGSRTWEAGSTAGANLTSLVADLVKALDWEAGTVWTEPDGGESVCQAHWSRSGRAAPEAGDLPWRPGVLTVPVPAGERTAGRLELLRGAGPPLNPQLDRALQAAARQLGDYLAHHGGVVASPLTARETEVLELASHGGSSASIADRLVVSTSTIKTHFEHIYDKLGVTDRAGAVAEGLRRGLID